MSCMFIAYSILVSGFEWSNAGFPGLSECWASSYCTVVTVNFALLGFVLGTLGSPESPATHHARYVVQRLMCSLLESENSSCTIVADYCSTPKLQDKDQNPDKIDEVNGKQF